MYTLIRKGLERRTESEVLVNKLAEEMYKHPNITKRVLKIINYIENTEIWLNIVDPKTQMDVPMMASEDKSTA